MNIDCILDAAHFDLSHTNKAEEGYTLPSLSTCKQTSTVVYTAGM